MRFLQDLTILSEGQSKTKGHDALPHDVMQEIKKNIKTGAKDNQQKWANALELVHKAYDVSGVQRPTPDMKNAWKQYEENLEYAVQQLSKYRGIKGDWRMSSSVFHEALEKRIKFKVQLSSPSGSSSYLTEARSLSEVIEEIKDGDLSGYDIKVKPAPDGLGATLQFYRFGVRVKYRVDINQIGIVGVNV
jgi:hypothetical protein